jgi:hypothetical protein
MTKSMLLCGLVLGATPFLTLARDFPLEFKTLTAQEAMAFPGGSGTTTPLQFDKPAGIFKAPPAISRQPLYGQLSAGTGQCWFRIDESKGNGKGYDRLLVDMNQNGDLTDDAAVQRVASAGQTSVITQNPEIALFGPIPAPDGKKIGDWRPIYFAQAYLYTLPAGAGTIPRNVYLGQMRMRAGWYLETTADLDGVTRKVGIVDGNCNFRVGDLNQPITAKSGVETNWYFQGGDYFLVDNDGTGKFQSSVGNDASAPFGPLLYFGAKPYKAVLAADCKSLALEPWTGPLAELALQPQGAQVSRIQLAWEGAPGQWQLLQAGVENGKAVVPPGNYSLYSCLIKVKSSPDETLVMSGTKRVVKEITRAEAGAVTPLKCGPPLEIKVSSSRDSGVVVATTSGSGSVFTRLFGNSKAADQPLQQRIQASVIGAGGETYSGFYLLGKGNVRQPPNPTYAIVSANGKLVESGNMEFG